MADITESFVANNLVDNILLEVVRTQNREESAEANFPVDESETLQSQGNENEPKSTMPSISVADKEEIKEETHEHEEEEKKLVGVILDEKPDEGHIPKDNALIENEQASQSLEDQMDMISDIVREVQEAEEALALEGGNLDNQNLKAEEEEEEGNNFEQSILVDIQVTPTKSDSNAAEGQQDNVEILGTEGQIEDTILVDDHDIVLIEKDDTCSQDQSGVAIQKEAIAVDELKEPYTMDNHSLDEPDQDDITEDTNITEENNKNDDAISSFETLSPDILSNENDLKKGHDDSGSWYGKYYQKVVPSVQKLMDEKVKPTVRSISNEANNRYTTVKDGTCSKINGISSYVNDRRMTSYSFVSAKSGETVEWVGSTTKNIRTKTVENAKSSVAAAKEITSKTISSAKDMTQTTIQNVKNVTSASIGVGLDKYKQSRTYVSGILTKVRRKNQLQELGMNGEVIISEEEEEYNRLLQYEKAAEVIVKAGKSERLLFYLEEGQTLTWDFQLKNKGLDIKFGAYERVQDFGGSKEILIFDECDNVRGAELISGQYMAERPMTIVLVWDNSYSRLRSKTVASCVRILKVPSSPYINMNPIYANTVPKTEIKPPLEILGEVIEEEAKEETETQPEAY